MVELGLAVIFEIPALIFVLSRIGLVSGPFLLRNTRYAVLIVLIVAAIITPTTDIPNMMMMAVPMIGLYMLGVVVAYLFGKKRDDKNPAIRLATGTDFRFQTEIQSHPLRSSSCARSLCRECPASAGTHGGNLEAVGAAFGRACRSGMPGGIIEVD